MAFDGVVHGVSQGERGQGAVTRQRVVQPVERAGAELDLLVLMDMEGPVDRQIVIEVRPGAHIGIVLTALRARLPARQSSFH